MTTPPILTRFPPEPNGYLHLGHVKAIMINFYRHAAEGGSCILRMDDTNPETEHLEYVNAIIEDVAWLGVTPLTITYTSDYFSRLYDCAITLIKMEKAYIDFTPTDKMKEERRAGIENIYRSHSIDWNLAEFEKMRYGCYKEGEACLRLKIDMKNVNHTLRDPIAYRIKYTPHYRTGTSWCIYPSYDFSHGLVDSFENITFSYCTTEFYVRRDLYNWPCVALDYKPATVHEFGRLGVEGNVLSKRKILALIRDGSVSSFDDPRLLTVRGLRRRGITAEMLKRIVENTSFDPVDCELKSAIINYTIRDCLDAEAHRYFAILSPRRITIMNVVSSKECLHPNHPKRPELGSHSKLLTSSLFIDSSDFRDDASADYFRLTPSKPVRLRYSEFIRFVEKDSTGDLVCETYTPAEPKKIKGNISWISNLDAIPAVFEIYGNLLTSDGMYNPSSKITMNGFVEKSILSALAMNITTFQFERVGYFRFDRFEEEIPIFLRVVELVNRYEL